MGDFVDHLNQAKHNMACAAHLAKTRYRDWAITAAFYSGIHYVEAGFSSNPNIEHSDTGRPHDEDAHSYRTRLVRSEYGDNCWRSYRKLSNASYMVRYLPTGDAKPGIGPDFYSQDDAQVFIDRDLTTIRSAVADHSGLNLD